MYKKIEYPKSYIVWDIETDGFDGKSKHVLEIGMFNVYNEDVIDKKRWVLDFGIDIPKEITEINGMTKEILKEEGMDPEKALKEFMEYILGSDANVTHNGIKFDIPFIVEQFKRFTDISDEEVEKIRTQLNNTAIDTAPMFKSRSVECPRLWNETFYDWAKSVLKIRARTKYNLGECCNQLGIDRTKVTQHRALGDVELTNEVYKSLIK